MADLVQTWRHRNLISSRIASPRERYCTDTALRIFNARVRRGDYESVQTDVVLGMAGNEIRSVVWRYRSLVFRLYSVANTNGIAGLTNKWLAKITKVMQAFPCAFLMRQSTVTTLVY